MTQDNPDSLVLDDHDAAPRNGWGKVSEATCRHCDRPITIVNGDEYGLTWKWAHV